MLGQLKTVVLIKEAIKLAFRLVECLEHQHLWVRLQAQNVLLLSCAPGPPTPLSILVRASLCCSVKGIVHSVVQELQFLGNFSHGIALISQNKNRLTNFRTKFFVSGHFEPVIEPTNADAPHTQLV